MGESVRGAEKNDISLAGFLRFRKQTPRLMKKRTSKGLSNLFHVRVRDSLGLARYKDGKEGQVRSGV